MAGLIDHAAIVRAARKPDPQAGGYQELLVLIGSSARGQVLLNYAADVYAMRHRVDEPHLPQGNGT